MNSNVSFVLLLILSISSLVAPSKVELKEKEIEPDSYIGQVFGVYTRDDAPSTSDKYPDAPSLQLDLSFALGSQQGRSMEVVVYHADASEFVGKDIDGQFSICCFDKLYEAGECDTLGRLILDEGLWKLPASKFYYLDVLEPNETKDAASISQLFKFEHSGVWRFVAFYCAVSEEGEYEDIKISGNTEWLNPYGHLPSTLYPLLPLYFLLAAFYFAIGVAWIVLSVRYRTDLQYLQNWIAFVIAAGFAENILYASDYLVYNGTGEISVAFNVFSVLFATAKRTASYIALVQCTIGATIIKPNLERKDKLKLIVLAIVYAVIAFLYRFIEMLRYTPQTEYLNVSEGVEIAFMIPAILLDFLFLFWIFTSYFNSLGFLAKNKQTIKLEMFKRLGITLAIAYVVSFIIFIVQVIGLFAALYDAWWRGWWFFTGYWSIMHLILLYVIGYLWRPNANNSRYAFSEQLATDAEEMRQTST